jgi:hypothetical protein
MDNLESNEQIEEFKEIFKQYIEIENSKIRNENLLLIKRIEEKKKRIESIANKMFNITIKNKQTNKIIFR